MYVGLTGWLTYVNYTWNILSNRWYGWLRRVGPQQDAEQHIKLKTDKAGLTEHFINPYKGKFLHFASSVCVSCTEPVNNNVELHNVNSKFITASYAYLNYTRLLHTGSVDLLLTF